MPGRLHDSGDVLVVGAGALGGYLAARLAASGQRVAVVARGQRRKEIQQHGLVLDMEGRRRVVRVPCHCITARSPAADLVILATKTTSLSEVLAEIGYWAKPPRALLTLQNGVEAPDIAAHCLPEVEVIAARVHGFFKLANGVVVHEGVAPDFAFGAWRSPDGIETDLLEARFTAAGIPFSCPSDIAAALWEKFLLASTIGSVGAATGITIGRLRETPEHWSLLGAAMREVQQLAAARGVRLPHDCVTRTLDFVASFPPNATSSLQRDLMDRRESEYDVLTGAVVRMGGECGLLQPTHARIEAQLIRNGMLGAEAV